MLAVDGMRRSIIAVVTGTAATLNKPHAYFGADLKTSTVYGGYQIDNQGDNTAIIRNVPVFRVGTFRDSMGDQQTWEPAQLQKMVDNFNLLKTSDIFPNVPVRKDHSISINNVVGYFESANFDGKTVHADLHLTEPDAIVKWGRGTFRSVSLEVGMYADNNDFPYWPVMFGVAFVDIPAVEGLHAKDVPENMSYFGRTTIDKENQVTAANATDTVPHTTININGVPTPEVRPGDPVLNHGAPPANAPFKFKLGGVETIDFAKVQAHIDGLETEAKVAAEFAKGVRNTNRTNYVNQLATEGKIGAPQVESLTALALTMDDAQFTGFQAAYAAAPKLSLLSNHGGGSGGAPAAPEGEFDAKKDRISILETTIDHFRRVKMSPDQIAKTDAAIELASLKGA